LVSESEELAKLKLPSLLIYGD